MPQFTNDLINETSPYLLQHAHNPVHWQPWSDKALEEAADTNKLIIVSVGYAACHWCHVMEHESFEDEAVADMMNEHYVSIKVDREERPDIDQVYMDAAQLLTGRGGWPLNVIALPDGRPIYAGTYFTREQWLKVLQGVHDFYLKTPEKALEQAMQVAAGVSKMNYLPFNQTADFKSSLVKEAAADWLNALDNREGGRAGQMKFPMPGAYLALLRYAVAFDDQRAKELVRLTLDKMASGGICDQIGGGFSRYSVDPLWHVPHFEKMLYDNAQMITLYSEAYKYYKDPFYLQVVNETIAFCMRELQSAQGGFMSSIDADSEGEEGQFYIWTSEELDHLLGKDAELFKTFYGVTAEGNWEAGKNVLKMTASLEELTKKFNLDSQEIGLKLTMARKILFQQRQQRARPRLDDKILTSWNALMITAFTHAFEASGNGKFRQLAIDTAEFIKENLWIGKRLHRSYKEGRATINAFLDDYTFLISAYLRLYSATFDKSWLNEADSMVKIVLEEYTQPKSDFFNFKSTQDKDLFVKKQVLEDNVIPAGNSEMAKNLFLLGSLLGNQDYLDLAKKQILQVAPRIQEQAAFYYNWFDLYALHTANFLEIAVVGEDWQKLRRQVAELFAPYAISMGGERPDLELLKGKLVEDKTLIYICLEKTCQAPLTEITEDQLVAIYKK